MKRSDESSATVRCTDRRKLLFASLACLGAIYSPVGHAAENCPGGRDLVLTNGALLTVDAADRTVNTVRIRGKRFLTVGEPVGRKEPCVDVVDLGGRTVIPGLIDNHTHFVRTAQAPGPFIAGLESADSIKELQDALATAAKKAEPGEWVAAIGGFTPKQFAEKRMPTREAMLTSHAVTGGVITSAGVVLAGTFAVLAVLPLVALTQLGVTVALGVLLDTLVVRSVLVPALTYDFGKRVWWPSRLARTLED